MSYIREQAAEKYPMWIGPKKDHKAWAKRIMYREEHKDPELMPIQVRFAQEALAETAI